MMRDFCVGVLEHTNRKASKRGRLTLICKNRKDIGVHTGSLVLQCTLLVGLLKCPGNGGAELL